jgi:23S rRNA (uracil1939-C5)-methyltransferase
VKVTIEKLVYGGEGLARVAGDGPRPLTVFVPFVLPGEEVEVTVLGQKKGFGHAKLDAVSQPSPQRVVSPCPYFQRCGGCHYQHLDYPHQLQTKQEILRETLRRTGKIDWTQEIPTIAGEPFHYRNRTRMRIHQMGAFEIGYYQYKSHKLIAVRECPISSPLINRALAALWKLGEQGMIPTFIREVEYFADAADERLLLELMLHAPLREQDESSRQSCHRYQDSRPSFNKLTFRNMASPCSALGRPRSSMPLRQTATRSVRGLFFRRTAFSPTRSSTWRRRVRAAA